MKAYKNIKRNFIEYIPVLGVVVYSYAYGIKIIMLFGFIYGVIMKLNRVNDEIIKNNGGEVNGTFS
jgi:hypothetical protein